VKKVWKRKEQTNSNKVCIHQGNTIEAFKIVGDKSPEAVEWLQRSIVCESSDPTNVDTLHTTLVIKAGMQVQIRAMSYFKFIITFPSLMLMEECLRNHGELNEWFTYIVKWNTSDQAETRRVWLEVFGVPMHGWIEDNFKKITEVWGSLICLDQLADTTINYESMKILVATDQFYRIEGDILLQIDDHGYRVIVSEIGAYVPSAQSCNDSTNEVGLGIEAIQDNVTKDVQRNNQISKNGGIQNKVFDVVEVVQESKVIGKNSKLDPNQKMDTAVQELEGIRNSNTEPNQDSPKTSPAGSDHSVSRTRSV